MKISKAALFLAYVAIGFLVLVPFSRAEPSASRSEVDFKTTITVNSGIDPDVSTTKTCVTDSPCTLRRAIVQANALSPDMRPVLIQFNMPATAQAGYVGALQAWRISLQAGAGPAALPALEQGGITIDGRTQAGGRTTGPAIILRGPGSGAKDALFVGADNSGLHDSNEVIGFAFQNFRNHLVVNSSLNAILDNWFGLDDKGEQAFLRGGNAENGSGERGLITAEGVMANVIEGNVFLGFNEVAAHLDGEGNFFAENFVGTDRSGGVPRKQTELDKLCGSLDWLGGGGISVMGAGQLVANNTLAGLRQEGVGADQPAAIRVAGQTQLIEDNAVGIDFTGREVGVCGRGIVLDGPREVQLNSNILVDTGLSAITLDGFSYDANELFGNVMRRQRSWPEAENAVQLGQQLPQALRNFVPAQVTGGFCTVITGTSGFGSPCPNCRVELFLDDRDRTQEALQSLAVVTSDANGNWQASLPRPLSDQEGLRTMSTLADAQTVPGLSAGTTSQLSGLYLAPACNFMPVVRAD